MAHLNCGEGETKRYVMNNGSCTDDFLCSNSPIKFISSDHLCDMIDTCGNENKICKITRGRPDLFTVMFQEIKSGCRAFPVCFPGVENLQELSSKCTKSNFLYPPASILYAIDNSKAICLHSYRAVKIFLVKCTSSLVAQENVRFHNVHCQEH